MYNFILFSASLLFFGTLLAADSNFEPNDHPSLKIPFIKETIVLDGNLDDNIWSEAAHAQNFSENTPGDRTKPKVKTEALIAYDIENLYVAFICEDDPGQVRASLQDRDEMWQDDYVGVLIDTYGNSNWAYFLFSNPIGVQGDSRFSTTAGEDDGFDAIYYSEGKITETGYQVEMKIPFSSLRFPDTDNQKWRINFWRNHPRESRYRYSWTAIDKDDPCFLCQFGTVENVHNIKPGSSLEILPYFIANQTGQLSADQADASFKNNDIKGATGGNVKWAVTPSLTVEAALNPDFSQVESDAGQVDVNTTFALFYPERRPFFQEGSDLFETWLDIVYTRSINNPLATAKIIGRWENATLAYLTAYDENTPLILPFEERSRLIVDAGESYSNILRFKRQFGENNYVGALVSDRRLEDGGILNYGIDGMYRFNDNYHLEFQLMRSITEEPDDTTLTAGFNTLRFSDRDKTAAFDNEKFNGSGYYASFERNAKHWNLDFDYWDNSPTFRAGNGFVTQNSSRRGIIWTGYNFYFDDHPVLDQIRPYLHVGRLWNYNGKVKDEWIYPALYLKLKGQINTEISYFLNNENYSGKQFNSINRLEFYFDSKFSEFASLGFFIRYGNFVDRENLVKGHGFQELEVWSNLKPLNNFTIEPRYTYAELIRNDNDKYVFSGSILRIRFNYQFTRELLLRLVTQYNRFNNRFLLEPLISYKINPFSIFYAGITQDKKNYSDRSFADVYNWTTVSRQYFIKFQYLFSL